jgi:hypothetical protein
MRQLTKEYLHELFEYIDGKLYWKTDRGPHKVKGKRAGCLDNRGYYVVSINNLSYQQHRIIWLYHHGNIPDCLDHINGKKDDNRIENLRQATFSQNQYNKKIPKHNTSGVKGVSWDKKRNKWYAQIEFSGKHYNLGRYDTIEEATQKVRQARENLHKEFARHE